MKQRAGFAPILTILVILGIGLVVASFLIGSRGNLTTSSPTPSATRTPNNDLANWKTYTSPVNSYSFKYPEGLKSDTGAAGAGFESIRFTFVGPTQTTSGRAQTELFDGYSFSVTKLGNTAQLDPKIEIDKAIVNSKENCISVSPVSNTTVAGVIVFQYSTDCLGTYTISYLSD